MYICYFVIDIRHKQYAFLEIDAKIQLYFYKSAFSAINFPYQKMSDVLWMMEDGRRWMMSEG